MIRLPTDPDDRKTRNERSGEMTASRKAVHEIVYGALGTLGDKTLTDLVGWLCCHWRETVCKLSDGRLRERDKTKRLGV